VEAVVIGTSPQHAEATVQECVDLGVDAVWMHRSVDGGCPCTYARAADPAHRAMKAVLSLTGRVPRRV